VDSFATFGLFCIRYLALTERDDCSLLGTICSNALNILRYNVHQFLYDDRVFTALVR
jgi:hypothetical protein